MAFISVETFESYSTGTDINGGSGGSNWTTNWTRSSGTAKVETKPAGGAGTGTKALKISTHACNLYRDFTGIAAGTVCFRVYISSATPDDQVLIILSNGATGLMYVQFKSDGNIQYNSGTSYTNYGTYSADTWYTIYMDFDDAAQDNKWRFKVDSGAYTAYVNTWTTYTEVNRFNFSSDSQDPALDFWIDDIGLTEVSSTSIKTVNGLAVASVKTINGLAIASVKSINGLT